MRFALLVALGQATEPSAFRAGQVNLALQRSNLVVKCECVRVHQGLRNRLGQEVTVAILAEDFDHVNLIPNFLITPLTFLGGVFYSIEMLPEPWGMVSRFNPVLYMVNALRYAMTGVSDVPWWQGLTALLLLNVAFGGVTWWLLKTGYKLRV